MSQLENRNCEVPAKNHNTKFHCKLQYNHNHLVFRLSSLGNFFSFPQKLHDVHIINSKHLIYIYIFIVLLLRRLCLHSQILRIAHSFYKPSFNTISHNILTVVYHTVNRIQPSPFLSFFFAFFFLRSFYSPVVPHAHPRRYNPPTFS